MASDVKRRRRRRRRPCGYLAPRDALPIVTGVPGSDLARHHSRMTEEGFTLSKSVRPYVRTDGDVTLRFVWRKREENVTSIWTWVIRLPMGRRS